MDLEWKQQGTCSELKIGNTAEREKAELFFADSVEDRKPAVKVCRRECPVRMQCLQFALENSEIWGVWGGADEKELRRALWLDSAGQPRGRSRFPDCPNCHARTQCLFIKQTCDRAKRKVIESVECSNCRFEWLAETSIEAVKIYWEKITEMTPVQTAPVPGVAQPAAKVRVRVPRGRISSWRTPPKTAAVVMLPVIVEEPVAEVPNSLVASAE